MWKNVFIEATLLSTLIFGGFYINAKLMIKEFQLSQKNILIENMNSSSKLHLSGNWFYKQSNKPLANISGRHTASRKNRSSISGLPQAPRAVVISGNKA